MAIYRSDQAQLTFAVEAAPGGYPELATAVTPSSGTSATLSGASTAGSRSMATSAWASASAIAVNDHVVIGTATAAETEIRRVLFIEGTWASTSTVMTLQVDVPTAFHHVNATAVRVVTATTDTDNDKIMTFVPGVYETVEVPDPEMAIEPRYYLGTASKRNPYQFLKGQQTYSGSLGGMVLLDGRALRFPIGRVNTTTTYVNTAGSADPTYGANIADSAGARKGDVYVLVDTAYGSIVTGTKLLFTGSTTAGTTSTATSEVRTHIGSASSTNLRLDFPLQFIHADNEFVYAILTTATGSTVHLDSVSGSIKIPYTHTITEEVDLDSVSWHLHVRDSSETDANDFDRRYYGGKIGNMSLSAEEGGLLTCGWDGVNFLGMSHNQKAQNSVAGNVTSGMPFYAIMQPIRNGDIQAPGTINPLSSTTGNSTAEPYYFSQGQVKLFSSVVARVRSFSLSINNNEEPRYYLRRTMGRHRGPSEILEQRREYTCSVTLALPDATTNTLSSQNVFKDLLMEGDYGGGMQGFTLELRFDRGVDDNIIITIPPIGATGHGGNASGAFINTAPHNITEANPMEVEAEILFRSLKIEVNDNIGVYP